jgi:hypothetical protein
MKIHQFLSETSKKRPWRGGKPGLSWLHGRRSAANNAAASTPNRPRELMLI